VHSCAVTHVTELAGEMISMDELFDTSRIPDDPEHWDALAARVATRARRARSPILWLGEHKSSWAAAALLLAASMLFAVLQQRSPAATSTLAWTEALAPDDAVGRTIATPDRPPALGVLLFASAGRAGTP
jgi:hypothetical protein